MSELVDFEGKMAISDAQVSKAFALIERAAMAGERAPQTQPHGPLSAGVVTELYRRGMVRGEIYTKNWRRFTLLTGPNKGRTTQNCPVAGARPYKIVNGTMPGTRFEDRVERPEPSKPRQLTKAELDELLSR